MSIIKNPLKALYFIGLFLVLLTTSCTLENKSPNSDQVSAEKAKTQAIKPMPAKVDLVAFGDFMLHRPQLNAAKEGGGYNFSRNFSALKENYIGKADLALINLETTLTDGSNGYTTFPVFSSPKEVARDFKEAGFSIVSTANNHSYDKGHKGLVSTLNFLEEAGLDYIGTGKEAAKPLIKDVNGIKLGFISYTYGLNGFDQSLKTSANPEAVSILSQENIERDCAYLKEQKVDAIIAFVHWGEEYQPQVSSAQTHFFEVLSDNGVLLTLGSHPHISQGVGARKVGDRNAYVAYSMGNFVSNQRREYMKNSRTESGLMVRARIEKDTNGQVYLRGFQPSPLYVDSYYAQGKRVYEVLPVEDVLNEDLPLERREEILPRLEESHKMFRQLIPVEMVLSL